MAMDPQSWRIRRGQKVLVEELLFSEAGIGGADVTFASFFVKASALGWLAGRSEVARGGFVSATA